MRTKEPKTFPPTEAERAGFYQGLKHHTMEKFYAGKYVIVELLEGIGKTQVGGEGGKTKLRDNRRHDSDRSSRTKDNQTVHEWSEVSGAHSSR